MADVTSQSSYTSSDENVATVDSNGQITAVSAGNATIAVSFEGETTEVDVTVGEPEPELQGIDVEPSSVNIAEGETKNLAVTANYE